MSVPSQDSLWKAMPYGGSVTIASIEFSGSFAMTVRASPSTSPHAWVSSE